MPWFPGQSSRRSAERERVWPGQPAALPPSLRVCTVAATAISPAGENWGSGNKSVGKGTRHVKYLEHPGDTGLDVVYSANPVGGLFTQPLLCWLLGGGQTVTEVS